MSQAIVRRLTSADVEQYREIRLHGLMHDPIAFNACYDEESVWPDERFAQRIGNATDGSAIFGAFLADTAGLVGVVGLQISTTLKLCHKATVWGMYVHPSARGMGIGRKLMMHLLEYARRCPPIERILLLVVSENTAATKLYESLGFRRYGVEPKAVKFGSIYFDDEMRVFEIVRQHSNSDTTDANGFAEASAE